MGPPNKEFLSKEEAAAVFYHDIFDYPLSAKEIIKWRVGKRGLPLFKKTKEISNVDGLYVLKGRRSLFYKKALRERIAGRKIEIAKKNAFILSRLPTIKGVFITGALAMNNPEEESDIDLMIITRRNYLWTTRLFVYLLLKIMNSEVRKPEDTNQKDKLCLNIWLDEPMLSWRISDRNIYSAHEIAQVIPIIDKENIYQRFLQKNNWILDYWPNSVRIENVKKKSKKKVDAVAFLEKFSFWIQYKYMEKRITREIVTLHKAIFHPKNWGKKIDELLSA